jgi:hypothetical protein
MAGGRNELVVNHGDKRLETGALRAVSDGSGRVPGGREDEDG